MFATLLAAPCLARFLGTAMGFGLAQQPSVIMTIFFAVGMGMALPYFLLAAFPQVIHWLPKPGAWMLRVKHVLGFLLAGTALWLGWVFVHQIRPNPPASVSFGPIQWVPFQKDKLQTLMSSGNPMFVDVTAEC